MKNFLHIYFKLLFYTKLHSYTQRETGETKNPQTGGICEVVTYFVSFCRRGGVGGGRVSRLYEVAGGSSSSSSRALLLLWPIKSGWARWSTTNVRTSPSQIPTFSFFVLEKNREKQTLVVYWGIKVRVCGDWVSLTQSYPSVGYIAEENKKNFSREQCFCLHHEKK